MTTASLNPGDVLIRALLYNGLTFAQIQQLQPADIDTTAGWIRADGASIPLTTQTQAAFDRFRAASESWIDPGAIEETLGRMEIVEEHAHRQLAGALWITSEDTQLIASTVGLGEPPILPLAVTFPFSIVHRLAPDDTHEIALASRAALQAAADWLEREWFAPAPSLRQRLMGALLEGKTIFLLANTGVNGLNLVYNLVMGRLLSPAAYSQLALVVTLQLLIGLLPSAWQTAAARFGAGYAARDDRTSVVQLMRFGRRMMIGIGVGLMLIGLVSAGALADVFQMDGSWLLIPILLVVPFFITAAADRGVLQGLNSFYWLTVAYVGEAVARLGLGVLLVALLLGTAAAVQGAVWGVAQSMLITWFLGWLALRHLPRQKPTSGPHPDQQAWLRLTGLTLTALIGQALITNGDFLLVKSLFAPSDSGLYAAVSVLGRIAYFGALPLTIIMVPLFARRQALDQPTRPLFLIMLAGGAVFCAVLLGIATLFPTVILNLFYGDAYLGAAGLLPIYTLAASLYVIVNLVITYRVALGKGGETILPMIAGVAQVIGILLFHESLQQVILVQVVLMSVLVVAVLWRGLKAN